MTLLKRITAFVLVFMMLFSLSAAAKTKAEIQQEINEKNKEAAEIRAHINALEGERQSILGKKNLIDAEINSLNVEIRALQTEIDGYNARIAEKEAEIAEKEEQISKKTAVFNTRIRVMYENKNTSYLEVLLTSKSFSDFLLKFDLIKQILTHDKDILEELEIAKAQLNEAKAVIEEDKESVESAKSLLDEKKATLKAKADEQQSLINEISRQKRESEADLKDVEAAESSLREEIRKLERANMGTKYTGGAFTWPCPGVYKITDNYGMRVHPVTGVYKMHTGIDIAAPTGTSVVAAASGTVIVAGWNTAYGNVVVLSHGGGLTTLYGHNSSIKVSKGQTVSAGQTIALVGSTGYSTGPHLHFEVSVNGSSSSPWNYFG